VFPTLNESGSGPTGLNMRSEGSAIRKSLPMSTGDFRQLNAKQMDTVMYHHSWYKKAVIALKKKGQSVTVKPYRVFLSGPGGVGKSHVIWLVHSDTLKLLRLSGTFEPDDVLLTVPTGDDVLLTVPTGDDVLLTVPTGDDVLLTVPTGDDVLLTVPTGDDVLLTVPTGVAAFNINGMTLSSAPLLGRSMMGFSLLTMTS